MLALCLGQLLTSPGFFQNHLPVVFGEGSKDADDQFASCGAGIYAQVQGLEDDTTVGKFSDQINEVVTAPAQAVETGDYDGIPLPQERKHFVQSGTLYREPGDLLLKDAVAATLLQDFYLGVGILICSAVETRAYPNIWFIVS